MFARLAMVATALALCVVVLGAYVRLSDAGLGCPDWPGCYGQLVVPSGASVSDANSAYPERPLEAAKAWKEMAHRYLAGSLGVLILVLAVLAWRRRHLPKQQVAVAFVLLGLVIGQAALGMWTVTLLLQPTIVVAHLLGGLATLALCLWLAVRHGALPAAVLSPSLRRCRPWVLLGGVLLVGQIALGGWTSTNYAALACPDFPTCHGAWWPQADFAEAFVIWREVGMNYEGGRLPSEARVAIHLAHRVGAVAAFLYIGVLTFALWRRAADQRMKVAASASLGLLGAQVCIGISNVVFGLPLLVAVAHNAVAALLLLSVVICIHYLWPPELDPT